MSAPQRLARAIAAARLRSAGVVFAFAAPLALAVGALAWRFAGPAQAALAVAALLAAAVPVALRRQRALDTRWAARRLNADPGMQDSADLLFADATTLGPLQQLQRDRLEHHLAATRNLDLRANWPARALLLAWSGGLATAAALLLWPATPAERAAAERAAVEASKDEATHYTLVGSQLDIAPPAYTGLPVRTETTLSAQAPEGARLRWRLRFSPQPETLVLRLHDGSTLPMKREGEDWVVEHTLTRSTLYRLVPTGALPLADDALHRLDAQPDQPPQLRVITPERSLSLRSEGQRQWALEFEASDDHGLGPARLQVTLAQGSGEQVTVTERSLALRGEGEPKQRRYRQSLDLASLGLAEGDDLIVRLEVADNRAPAPQRARSASLILRWPLPPSGESTGMEGLVKKTLPAYFRSQRQIIIDAEALVAERGRLAADAFLDRSDAIGVDQRILRMRYGQFLGEENAGQPEAPPDEDGEVHTEDDGHDHGDEGGAALGGAISVLEEYGHTHDDAEAATLLDPETRALLKQALDAMWSSEGELRQGQPARALPHAYRALGFIKQVQQASRIYLARVGLELPPIDEARRMTGKREGLGDRRTGLVPAETKDSPVPALWRALDEGGALELQPFADWLQANETKLEDPLSLVAALDALRAQPDSPEHRQHLRALLWPLLPPPVAGVAPRPAPDATGAAYLDALTEEPSP